MNELRGHQEEVHIVLVFIHISLFLEVSTREPILIGRRKGEIELCCLSILWISCFTLIK